MTPPEDYDIICFSHLRWNFVYQRPQHVLSHFSRNHRIFFIEEPVFDDTGDRYYLRKEENINVWVVVPHLASHLTSDEINDRLREMINHILDTSQVTDYITWYYTPLALKFTEHLQPLLTVYDCMDELSAFKFAPPELLEYETRLMERTAVMFTGGHSLFEAKKSKHNNIFAFPSSIDKDHFGTARDLKSEPEDQRSIPHPRLGFFGVIDERFDIDLIKAVAGRRPDLNFVLIGPVVKIDPSTLPYADNIHYLGGKTYAELPQYLSGWDVALMPFARNESTRFISPTKTPEYLSGGRPVISTSIQDVVQPYGQSGFVEIADTPVEFIEAIDKILGMHPDTYTTWLDGVDQFLADMSWNKTCNAMSEHIEHSLLNFRSQTQEKCLTILS